MRILKVVERLDPEHERAPHRPPRVVPVVDLIAFGRPGHPVGGWPLKGPGGLSVAVGDEPRVGLPQNPRTVVIPSWPYVASSRIHGWANGTGLRSNVVCHVHASKSMSWCVMDSMK